MKKLNPKEPKLLTLILTATAGILLGGMLGMSLLMARPATVVATVPEEGVLSQPGNYSTYYSPGRIDVGESANLRSGKGRILRRSPGPVSFSEGEVNYFFKNLEFGDPVEPTDGDSARIGPFNVRIVGDEIFASLKVVVDPNGSPFEMLVLAEIGFENTNAGPELYVKGVRINSLPVPGLVGLVSSMIKSSVAETSWPEEVLEMWQNIRSIQVESGKLITEVGLRRA